MKNSNKFGCFTDNQIKLIIFMLCNITKNFDQVLEVPLPEVIFLILKDLLSISFKETKQYKLDREIAYYRITVQVFKPKFGRIEFFFCFLNAFFQNFCIASELKQLFFFIVSVISLCRIRRIYYLFSFYAFFNNAGVF